MTFKLEIIKNDGYFFLYKIITLLLKTIFSIEI